MNKISENSYQILGGGRLTFCDIGARGGLPLGWDEVGDHLSVIAFEPDETEAKTLASKIEVTGAKTKILSKAVWSSNSSETLNLTRSGGCSSLLSPNFDFMITINWD